MKRILILVLLVGMNSFAEDHSGGTSGGDRPIVDPNAQLNRLNELISACSPGRPGAGAVGNGGGAPNQVFIPPVTTIPPAQISGGGASDELALNDGASGGNVSNGAIIYQNRCIPCHSTNKAAPALTGSGKISKIAQVQSDKMPKDGALNAAEKADLLAYLNTLTE